MIVFEVRKNRAGKWFVREVGGGRKLNHSQAYFSKWNAKRAAMARALRTPGAIWRVIE